MSAHTGTANNESSNIDAARVVDHDRAERAIRELLEAIGEDPTREGLLDTPARVARMWTEVLVGTNNDPDHHLSRTFEIEHDEMVLVKDVEMYSLCEHHLAPFFGRAHIAYIPDKKIVGLSKIARVVDVFARRLQVQERLTMQIAHALQDVLKPKGVGVIVEARHLCMMMRGVEKQNSSTVTSCLLGLFRSDERTRTEFLKLARGC